LEDLSWKGVLYGKLIARTIDFLIIALLVFLVVKKLGVQA
jgi:large-conductance mechanosensitive channel